MAPRSARKRKVNENDVGALHRRKKREDTPMKPSAGGAVGGSGGGAAERDGSPPLVDPSPAWTPPPPEPQQRELTATPRDGVSSSFDPDESQHMGTMDDSPCGEQPEDLFPLMLETQYEEDEEQEEQEGDTSITEAIDESVVYSVTQGGPDGTNGPSEYDDVPLDYDERRCEDEEDDGDYTRESLSRASASIEEMLQQLAEVASNFIANYRELTSEGDAIQAELNELNEAQEARCTKMLGRLKRARDSISLFGQEAHEDDALAAHDGQAGMTHAQA